MTSGLWLDMLTSPRSMSRQDARRIGYQFLAKVFHRHFTADGPIEAATEMPPK
jgi:hypothetical protein